MLSCSIPVDLISTHFTNTSGLIHRKRVFFSGKVVGMPTREPRGFIARVYASDPGASLRGAARLGTFEVIVILLAFIGLRYPLGGETCLHVLTSPTIFQVSRAVRVETRREICTGDSVRVNSEFHVFVADLAFPGAQLALAPPGVRLTRAPLGVVPEQSYARSVFSVPLAPETQTIG
uniref:Uncharacterized protein n=1 Tax=Ananas comosus var. bracteatus TaxID=296719 RepID=A0A6V7QWS1_ANACO